MTYLVDATNEDQRRELLALEQAFRDTFRSAAGKRVIFWLLEQCGIYRDPDCGENTHLTSATIGEQRVGRKLIAKLDEIDPRFYPQLLLDIADLKLMDRSAQQRRNVKEIEDDEDA